MELESASDGVWNTRLEDYSECYGFSIKTFEYLIKEDDGDGDDIDIDWLNWG